VCVCSERGAVMAPARTCGIHSSACDARRAAAGVFAFVRSAGLTDRDAIYGESRHDVADRDAIYGKSWAARRADRHVCVCLRLVRPAGCRARSAAGVTWITRTANAPWAARLRHTSMIDAASVIYVIGGLGGTTSGTVLNDVWASTDGGADPT
jgi:hypothetical protein